MIIIAHKHIWYASLVA